VVVENPRKNPVHVVRDLVENPVHVVRDLVENPVHVVRDPVVANTVPKMTENAARSLDQKENQVHVKVLENFARDPVPARRVSTKEAPVMVVAAMDPPNVAQTKCMI
jgi:hypothetical protein